MSIFDGNWMEREFMRSPSERLELQQERDLIEWETREAWTIDDNFKKYLENKL